MKNFIQPGNTITLAAPAAVTSGSGLLVGAIFGIAATLMQLMSAMGPAFFGMLYDLSGGYRLPLGLAALLNIFAAIVILIGRTKPTQQ